MTPLQWIKSLGVEVTYIEPDSVQLTGLDQLCQEKAINVVSYARLHKPRLLAELRSHVRDKCDPLAGAMCKHCVHHSVVCVCSGPCTAKGMVRDPQCVACHAFVAKSTRWKRRRPESRPTVESDISIRTRRMEVRQRVASWRVARLWLLPRMSRLMSAGFTNKELFAVGVLRYPYTWGVAWSSKWADPEWRVSMNDQGYLEWRTANPTRRTVSQTTRPMATMTKRVS